MHGFAFLSCAAWCAIDLGFEAGQHPVLADALGRAFQAESGPMRWLAAYFTHGTFDPADVAATVVGAAAAAALSYAVGAHPVELEHER